MFVKALSVGELNCYVDDSFSLKLTGNGQLNNLTFVVKDNIALKDHVSSFGHGAWRATHKKSEKTAPAIVKLLDADATVNLHLVVSIFK